MKLHLPLAFATFARHSFAEPALRGQEQESSSVSRSLTSGFSSVGTGLCSDYNSKYYDRATFSGIYTRDSCESTCVPIGGNLKLVGYEYSDTLNICNCRFTAGYINTSQLGGVGNCPSGAYADWGGEACKVVPLTQGGSGVGEVTQAGGDSRYACFRNENFAICEAVPLASGYRYGCPDIMSSEDMWIGILLSECQWNCDAEGVGCCYYDRGICRWKSYADAPVREFWDIYGFAGLICD